MEPDSPGPTKKRRLFTEEVGVQGPAKGNKCGNRKTNVRKTKKEIRAKRAAASETMCSGEVRSEIDFPVEGLTKKEEAGSKSQCEKEEGWGGCPKTATEAP